MNFLEDIAKSDTNGFSEAFELLNANNDHYNSNDDHVYKMQREAGVRTWLSQKKTLVQVKAIMQTMPRENSKDRYSHLYISYANFSLNLNIF